MNNYQELSMMSGLFIFEDVYLDALDEERLYLTSRSEADYPSVEFEVNTEAPQVLAAYMMNQLAYGS